MRRQARSAVSEVRGSAGAAAVARARRALPSARVAVLLPRPSDASDPPSHPDRPNIRYSATRRSRARQQARAGEGKEAVRARTRYRRCRDMAALQRRKGAIGDGEGRGRRHAGGSAAAVHFAREKCLCRRGRSQGRRRVTATRLIKAHGRHRRFIAPQKATGAATQRMEAITVRNMPLWEGSGGRKVAATNRASPSYCRLIAGRKARHAMLAVAALPDPAQREACRQEQRRIYTVLVTQNICCPEQAGAVARQRQERRRNCAGASARLPPASDTRRRSTPPSDASPVG